MLKWPLVIQLTVTDNSSSPDDSTANSTINHTNTLHSLQLSLSFLLAYTLEEVVAVAGVHSHG